MLVYIPTYRSVSEQTLKLKNVSSLPVFGGCSQ